MDQNSCVSKLQATAITETLNTLRGLPAKVNEKQMAGLGHRDGVESAGPCLHVITQVHHHNTGGKTMAEVYSSFKQAAASSNVFLKDPVQKTDFFLSENY